MKLLEALSVRGVTAHSRVMFGPHETNLGRNRELSERHVPYYTRRAAGGAGILVIEEASVHGSDHPYERAPLAEQCENGWRAIGESIQQTGVGTIVLAALGHSGGQGSSHWNQQPMLAPSAVPEVASREVPKVLEHHEIASIVDGFRLASAGAMRAGLHGVEVNVGQFSLVRQFLSALTNMRADGYGTDRLRFAREVLAAARQGAGPDGIVGLRLCVDEMAPWAGIVPEAGAEIAVALAPLVDIITVVRGSIFTTWATRPDGHIEPGFGIDLARQVRTALRAAGSVIPVMAQGSIVDWGQAEWAIESEACDGVEMTRAQLADASLVSKLRTGDFDQVRPCVLCNQTCKVRDNRNPIVSCVVDPSTGYEWQEPVAPSTRRVVSPTSVPPVVSTVVSVVGGGLAGLECARVSAAAGATVHVYETADVLGGVNRVAAIGAGRSRLALIGDWLEAECRRLGVALHTNTTVGSAELAQLRANGRVVLCTGATNGLVPFTSAPEAVVVTAAEVLRTPHLIPEGPVLVWDPIGGPIAISVAELLAGQGRPVTLLTPDLLVGEKLALSGDLAPAQNRLHAAGITLIKQCLLRHVDHNTVRFEDRFTGVSQMVSANAVVVCGHRLPNRMLDEGETLPQAGDRVAPRSIYEAILEGRRVAILGPN